LFRRRRELKKAGEDFEGIRFANVKDAAAKTGATVSVIDVPAAGRRDLGGGRGRARLAICITVVRSATCWK
jgi:hypothetical protein